MSAHDTGIEWCDHSEAVKLAHEVIGQDYLPGADTLQLADAVLTMAGEIERYKKLERERWRSARKAFGNNLTPVVKIPPHESLVPRDGGEEKT